MTLNDAVTEPDSGTQPATRAQTAVRVALSVLAVVLVALHIIGLFYYPAFATSDLPQSPLRVDAIRSALNQVNLSFDWFIGYLISVDVFNTLTNLTLSALLLWRKANNWFVLYLSAMFVLSISLPYSLVTLWSGLWVVVRAFEGAGIYLFFILFYLFPNGRFVPGWTRWLLIVFGVGYLSAIVFPSEPVTPDLFDLALLIALAVVILIGILSQIYRYRKVSNRIERQQTKWPIFFFSLWMIRTLILVLPPPMQDLMAEPSPRGLLLNFVTLTSSYLLFALGMIAIVLAIFRYRLFDIDLIIRRTVLWTIISGLGLGLYLLAVGATSFFLGSQPDYVIPLVSLILVAFIARPLYRRLDAMLERVWSSNKETLS